jgi:ligand-binding sensor domain-containing protein
MVSGDSLLVLTSYSLLIIRNESIIREILGVEQVNKITGVTGNNIFISTNQGLCEVSSISNKKYYFPNSPTTNSFLSLTSDRKGNLWVATGRLNGSGFINYRMMFGKTILHSIIRLC